MDNTKDNYRVFGINDTINSSHFDENETVYVPLKSGEKIKVKRGSKTYTLSRTDDGADISPTLHGKSRFSEDETIRIGSMLYKLGSVYGNIATELTIEEIKLLGTNTSIQVIFTMDLSLNSNPVFEGFTVYEKGTEVNVSSIVASTDEDDTLIFNLASSISNINHIKITYSEPTNASNRITAQVNSETSIIYLPYGDYANPGYDITPPKFVSLEAVNTNHIKLIFDSPLSSLSNDQSIKDQFTIRKHGSTVNKVINYFEVNGNDLQITLLNETQTTDINNIEVIYFPKILKLNFNETEK